ncbi:hypothetical protein [Hasllibacter sp. MH4015]|uniref:hypothetical protein n=1 Tax=Hasllibacter sp. MH4015 TaxID=2854029 RepID=UPI001CD60CA3|nr:hypothetical protein [Hasllibacter sp. MH4015]
MHEIIRKIDIAAQPQTGVMKERELFAQMKAEERAALKRARRARRLEWLGWRRAPTRTAPTRRDR